MIDSIADSIAAAMSRKLALDLDVAEGRPGFVLNRVCL